jgi:hypothetical protein
MIFNGVEMAVGKDRRIEELEQALKEILENSEWAKHAIDEKLNFGMGEALGVYRRESRCNGVFLTTIKTCKEALGIKDDE